LLLPVAVAAINTALSNLTKTVPGGTSDLQIRGEVEAAVGAVVALFEREFYEATEAETRQALEALQSLGDPSGAATRRVMEE